MKPRLASLLLGVIACAQDSRDFVVLDADATAAVLDQCSRPTPQYEGTWHVSPDVVSALENNLHRIAQLEAQCCIVGERIADPKSFGRQYAGILIDGKQYVYINAFDRRTVADVRQGVDVCDVGPRFWGA